MKHKYTIDGKLVKILKSLDDDKYIVQEVCVIDGKEVIFGKEFIVDILSNSPINTYKLSNIINSEQDYDELLENLEQKKKELYHRIREIEAHYEYIGKILKNTDESTFNTVINFLTGNIKWIVIKDTFPSILEWDVSKLNFRELRLISLFGKDDGSLQYGVNKYSGNTETNIYFFPFTNYKDAFDKFKEFVLEAEISLKLIECAKKYDIQLDTEKLSKWKERQIQSCLKSIKQCNVEIIANNKAIDKLSNL